MPPLPTSILAASRRARDDSRSESAYRRIREMIISLELPPAAVVDEAALMESLGLGRTPVREALQRLALEDLVIILPRQGTIVADINLSDLQKIFELRLELESFAARLAAERATREQVEATRTLLAESEAVLQSGDHRQLIRLDAHAHRLFAQAAHNEFLEAALERHYHHVLRLWHISLHRVGRLREAIEEHRDIAAAVEARDGERAACVMRAHVAGFQALFAAAL